MNQSIQNQKYIDLRYHSIRKLVKNNYIDLKYVKYKYNLSVGLTKYLNSSLMNKFRSYILSSFNDLMILNSKGNVRNKI